MPMLIAVSGLPGVGKTYFARRLAETIKAVHIGSDDVRIAIGARGQYAMKDKMKVYETMASIARDHLSHGRSVVVEATFHHHNMRTLFTALAQERNVRLRLIVVSAAPDLVRQRLSKKRPDSDADWAVHEYIKSRFEPFQMPHLELQSGTNNIDDMIARAVAYIEEAND